MFSSSSEPRMLQRGLCNLHARSLPRAQPLAPHVGRRHRILRAMCVVEQRAGAGGWSGWGPGSGDGDAKTAAATSPMQMLAMRDRNQSTRMGTCHRLLIQHPHQWHAPSSASCRKGSREHCATNYARNKGGMPLPRTRRVHEAPSHGVAARASVGTAMPHCAERGKRCARAIVVTVIMCKL
jgi:hypothetical protein